MTQYIFQHIPKCGGTSITNAMREALAKDELIVCHEEEELRSIPKSRLEKAKVIAGHLRFGVHLALPGGWRYITCLREPEERFKSFLSYHDETPTLSERYISEQDNCIVRYISGREVWDKDPCNVGQIDVAFAERNLEYHYDLVFYLEKLADGLEKLGELLQVSLEKKHDNKTKGKLAPTTTEFKPYFYYDEQIYEHVKDMRAN